MEPADSSRSYAAYRSRNELAAASLREQAETFKKKAVQATEKPNTGGLHEARVALRRMKIAGSRKLRQRIEKLDRPLGRARDAEVVAADASRFAEKLPPGGKACFAVFTEDLALVRERETETMRETLGGKNAEKVCSRASREAKRLEREAASAPPRPAGLDASVAATKAYADLAAFEAPASGGAADEALYHDIRRAAKRFRYTLEMFEPILGPRCRELIDAARSLQDFLGKLNDASICARAAADLLSRRSENPGGPLPAQYPEVAGYLAAKLRIVKRIVAAFPREWRRVASPAFRKRLHSVLGACPVDFAPAAHNPETP